jgi:hypothetical protein
MRFALAVSSEDGTEYGLNIGRFIVDYSRLWVITAGPYGAGYAARWRNRNGQGRGQTFTAVTLDQLAAILDREQNRRQVTS